jgi:hypothetical protein
MMSVDNYISEIISFVAGLGAGSLITLRIARKNRDLVSGGSVNQSGAKAGGDVVGRDKNTTTRK